MINARRLFQITLPAMVCLLTATAALTGGEIRWQPLVHPEGNIYPSLVLASVLADQRLQHPVHALAKHWSAAGAQGDPRRFIGISLQVPRDASMVTVSIECLDSDLLLPSSEDFLLSEFKAGDSVALYPYLNWNYRALAGWEGSRSINLQFAISIDGSAALCKGQRATVQSVQLCPFHILGIDALWMFAAYVDEDHPAIQKLITEAAEFAKSAKYDVAFCGYQQGGENALRQVAAIWAQIQRHGFTYINTPFTSSTEQNIFHQAILPLDRVLADRRGNCVETSALLVSALTKLGINSCLFTVPGHMYVAIYAPIKGQQFDVRFLETTFLHTAENKPSPFYSALINDCMLALQVGQANFVRVLRESVARGQALFDDLWIKELRNLGVTPSIAVV